MSESTTVWNLLSLLLLPVVGLLLSINAKLASLGATQAAQARQLETLQHVPADLAGLRAVQAEHARRLNQAQGGTPHHNPA